MLNFFSVLLLTTRIVSLLTTTGHDPTPDAFVFAQACIESQTPEVSAQRLCAVAFVESRYKFRAVNSGGHCGAWQQAPRWSQMFGDDCWTPDGRLTCRQPGGEGVVCEELMDVYLAARVAARHLTLIEQRRNEDGLGLCRYAGATGERCRHYRTAVARAERHLNSQP
jgi:hypothetical protein